MNLEKGENGEKEKKKKKKILKHFFHKIKLKKEEEEEQKILITTLHDLYVYRLTCYNTTTTINTYIIREREREKIISSIFWFFEKKYINCNRAI